MWDQRADTVVSASTIAVKLVCVAAKPPAHQGREDGGREGVREGSREMVTHPKG